MRPRFSPGRRRLAERLLVCVFRAGLAPLLRKRLLLLHHTGRGTGLDHHAVLDVVGHDPVDGSWIVASPSGPPADWYEDLRAQPKTVIQFGNRHHAVTAYFLAPDEGADIMAFYGQRHPRTARRLRVLMGLSAQSGPAALRKAARTVAVVRLADSDDKRLP
jgi:deazaflavin-dependent oxidoreductase (nitroreductase family)